MRLSTSETRYLVPGFLVLFLGLAVLSVFLLAGESRRARILVEYEADRTVYALAESFRTAGSVDPAAIDPRVRGFAVYGPSGEAVAQMGDAPVTLDFNQARPGFRFDAGHRLLTLVRFAGMGGPGMRRMMRGMMGGAPRGAPGAGMMGDGPWPRGSFTGPAGALFLSMDISSYYRTRLLYRTAAVIAPVAVAGIAALFLVLLASNARNRRKAEERETLARLGESARTLTHEIRNPLGAIRIQTGLLRKKTAPAAAAHLDAIDEEIERLSVLTRRVSDFIRNPGGNPGPIRLETFLRELCARLPGSPAFAAAGDQSGTEVVFDGELLRSVVENLVRNAQESYDGSVSQGGVEVELFREKGQAVIAVRDRGKGIPGELAQRVFDPFFTDKIHGSGVGLSLSRRFVEAAGGTLTLSPRRGGGTEARVVLPAKGAA